MQYLQYDSHEQYDAYGQHGPEEDRIDADYHCWDYVYVYGACGSGGGIAGALAGVGDGGWGTWSEPAAAGDTVKKGHGQGLAMVR